MFIILGDCAVVFLAALMIVHPLQDLLHLGRHGHRGAHAVGAVQRVVQVFDMQVDFKTGLIVALDHHRSLGVHHRAACQAAADGLEHQLRVHACLLRQGEGFGQCLDIARHNNLIEDYAMKCRQYFTEV